MRLLALFACLCLGLIVHAAPKKEAKKDATAKAPDSESDAKEAKDAPEANATP